VVPCPCPHYGSGSADLCKVCYGEKLVTIEKRDAWLASPDGKRHIEAGKRAQAFLAARAELAKWQATWDSNDPRAPAIAVGRADERARIKTALLEETKCVYLETCDEDDEPCDGCKLRAMIERVLGGE
jgi:hypothetical protein